MSARARPGATGTARLTRGASYYPARGRSSNARRTCATIALRATGARAIAAAGARDLRSRRIDFGPSVARPRDTATACGVDAPRVRRFQLARERASPRDALRQHAICPVPARGRASPVPDHPAKRDRRHSWGGTGAKRGCGPGSRQPGAGLGLGRREGGGRRRQRGCHLSHHESQSSMAVPRAARRRKCPGEKILSDLVFRWPRRRDDESKRVSFATTFSTP